MKKIFNFNKKEKTEKTNWLGVNWLANTKLGKGLTKGFFLLTAAGIMFMVTSCKKECKITNCPVGQELVTNDDGSCGCKDKPKEPIDPNAELLKEIAKLEKDSVNATNNCRVARHNALHDPEDISAGWGNLFGSYGGGKEKSFADTLTTDEKVIERLDNQYGETWPKNDPSGKAYKGSITSWKQVKATLTSKRGQLK